MTGREAGETAINISQRGLIGCPFDTDACRTP